MDRCLLAMIVILSTVPVVAQETPDAFEYNRRLGRGVNLGNALEAPREGDWGMTLEAAFFERIADAGFDAVRIPLRWSAHAAERPPYRIDDAFLDRVDWAVDQALDHGLLAVINMHHYNALYEDPEQQRPRFLAMWRQIADHFASRPPELFFEILNEPHGNLSADRWNRQLGQAVDVIRESNPQRMVIVGPARWNNPAALNRLDLPDDRRLIVTFHYYQPVELTHQGAGWVDGSDEWLGTQWTGTEEEEQAVVEDFEAAAAWGDAHDRPLYLGEFGAYSEADMDSRARWTRFVRRQAERHGMSWAYWEFGAGFGVYDREAEQWRAPLRRALIGE